VTTWRVVIGIATYQTPNRIRSCASTYQEHHTRRSHYQLATEVLGIDKSRHWRCLGRSADVFGQTQAMKRRRAVVQQPWFHCNYHCISAWIGEPQMGSWQSYQARPPAIKTATTTFRSPDPWNRDPAAVGTTDGAAGVSVSAVCE
jgi:hypothetical protein